MINFNVSAYRIHTHVYMVLGSKTTFCRLRSTRSLKTYWTFASCHYIIRHFQRTCSKNVLYIFLLLLPILCHELCVLKSPYLCDELSHKANRMACFSLDACVNAHTKERESNLKSEFRPSVISYVPTATTHV